MRRNPKMQTVINRIARQYLSLYRHSRKHDDPATARWRAHFAIMIDANCKAFNVFDAVYYRNNKHHNTPA